MAEKFRLEYDNAQYFLPEIGKWITGQIRISKDFIYLSYSDEWIPIILKEIVDISKVDETTIMIGVKTIEKEFSVYIKHDEKKTKRIFAVINKGLTKVSPFTPLYRTMFIIVMSAVAIYLVFNIFLPQLTAFLNPVIEAKTYVDLSLKTDEFLLNAFENVSSFSEAIVRTEFGCTNYEFSDFEIYACDYLDNSTSIYNVWVNTQTSEAESRADLICNIDTLCRNLKYLRCAEVLDGLTNHYYWYVDRFAFYSTNEEGINGFQEIYCKKT